MTQLADWRRAGAYKGLCSLSVKGADKHVPLLPGGLDGRYKLHHCEGGRPAYVREKSPPARAHFMSGCRRLLCSAFSIKAQCTAY